MNMYERLTFTLAVAFFACMSSYVVVAYAGTSRGSNAQDANKATLSPVCAQLLANGKNQFWLKHRTNQPLEIRRLRDDALSGNLDDFRSAYLEVERDSEKIHKAYAKTDPADSLSHNLIRNQLIGALDDAAATGHTDIIAFLVDHGVNANSVSDFQQEPAVMLAVLCNRVGSLQELFKFGANVNATLPVDARGGWNPMDAVEEAVALGNNNSIAWLLAHGATVCSPPASTRIKHLLADPEIRTRVDPNLLDRLQCSGGGPRATKQNPESS